MEKEVLKDRNGLNAYLEGAAGQAKGDCLAKLWHTLKAYHEVEEELITTSPELCESDLEMNPGSCKWSRFPVEGERTETVPDMILSGLEYFPNDCLLVFWRKY
jgi:hypothetical protein